MNMTRALIPINYQYVLSTNIGRKIFAYRSTVISDGTIYVNQRKVLQIWIG